MEERTKLQSKTRRNRSKNAYISQNKSKKARESEINGLQGAKTGLYKAKCPQNALEAPQIRVQARVLETIRDVFKAVLLWQERFLGCYKPILTAIKLL